MSARRLDRPRSIGKCTLRTLKTRQQKIMAGHACLRWQFPNVDRSFSHCPLVQFPLLPIDRGSHDNLVVE
jgi:hypothetical protein